jgi:hypothetical protein
MHAVYALRIHPWVTPETGKNMQHIFFLNAPEFARYKCVIGFMVRYTAHDTTVMSRHLSVWCGGWILLSRGVAGFGMGVPNKELVFRLDL